VTKDENEFKLKVGSWNIVMMSMKANGDITVAVNDKNRTDINYKTKEGSPIDSDGHPVKPYGVSGDIADFFGGARCGDTSPIPPLDFPGMLVTPGGETILGPSGIDSSPYALAGMRDVGLLYRLV